MARWKHEIAIAIARRRAAMARSVQPGANARQQWLINGLVDLALTGERGMRPLEDDETLTGLPPILEDPLKGDVVEGDNEVEDRDSEKKRILNFKTLKFEFNTFYLS